MRTKQKLISISEELAQKLRACCIYEAGDSYREIVQKLLDYYEKKHKPQLPVAQPEEAQLEEVQTVVEQPVEPETKNYTEVTQPTEQPPEG